MSALLDGKVIVSHHLPPLPNDGHLPPSVKEITYMAFRTRYQGKTIITGIGIGKVDEKGEFLTTPTTQGVINAIGKSPEFKGRLIIVECGNSNTGNQRMVTAIKAANDGDAVLILCRDDTVYDDVDIHRLLGVETRPIA